MQTTFSSRDLTRRWYGQIQQQPDFVREPVAPYAAHSIIPNCETATFGHSPFVPLDNVLDVCLTGLPNVIDGSIATTTAVYKTTYDAMTNEITIGTERNLEMMKDLRNRPFKGGKRKVIDPETCGGLLLTILDMDSEREAASKRKQLLQLPTFDVLLGFEKEKKPYFTLTENLQFLAWLAVQPFSKPLRSMCAPEGYSGSVKRIYNEPTCRLIELTDQEQYLTQVPNWATLRVRQGDLVKSGQSLASVAISQKILNPIKKANRDFTGVWNGLQQFLGDDDTHDLLEYVWASNCTEWAGLNLIPHYLLTQHQAQGEFCSVWRDLRNVLGRECHHFKNPIQVVKTSPKEGRISVWFTNNDPNQLTHEMLGGLMDFSVPHCDQETINDRVNVSAETTDIAG